MREVILPCLIFVLTLMSAWNLPYQRQRSRVTRAMSFAVRTLDDFVGAAVMAISSKNPVHVIVSALILRRVAEYDGGRAQFYDLAAPQEHCLIRQTTCLLNEVRHQHNGH